MKKLTKAQKKTWDILSTDTQTVDFKKFREENDDFWLNEKRELIWLPSMETSHIINCINMLERCGQTDTKSYLGLCNELNHRYGNERWKYEN